jgi:hypothetical protein
MNVQTGGANVYPLHQKLDDARLLSGKKFVPNGIKPFDSVTYLGLAPATVADLHALLLDQLVDLRARIARENTDIYKLFWNLDGYSRPQAPRPEEACRDTLVTLLRPAARTCSSSTQMNASIAVFASRNARSTQSSRTPRPDLKNGSASMPNMRGCGRTSP